LMPQKNPAKKAGFFVYINSYNF